jgi:tetratricopeptide (TPR) repeat protein
LAIEQKIGNRWSMGFSLANLGNVAYVLGDYGEANGLFQQGLAIAEAIGDPRGIARCLNRLARTAVARECDEDALALYECSLNLYRDIGEQFGMTTSLTGLGRVAWRQQRWVEAKAYYDEALIRAWEIRAAPRVIDILQEMAALLAELGASFWLERMNRLVDNELPTDSLEQVVAQILKTAVPLELK